ncbi:MAG: ABC transporter permease [Pseudomonadota bacterium]
MLLKMAWRNIWRKKKRTLITVISLAAGVWGITFMHSFGEGVWSTVVQMTTAAYLGQMQVRALGWEDEPAIYNTVSDPAAVEDSLARVLPGAQALPRVTGFGMALGQEVSTGVMIMGIAPAREREGGELLVITEGRELAEARAGEALLGHELARQLELGVGDELVLLGQAADGSTANDRYTVVGLCDAGTHELNGGAVFLHLADAQDFFVLERGVHQILVNTDRDPYAVAGPLAKLRGALDLGMLEVLGWNEIAPELEAVVKQKRQGWYFLDFVVFFIVGLGVFNVMAMSTFERTHEFGVMASLGTRRRRILGLVLLEAGLQGAVALALGLGLATVLLYGLGSVDLSALSEQDMMGFRMPSELAGHLTLQAVAAACATVAMTTLVGALWPAWRASRLQPVEAVRKA